MHSPFRTLPTILLLCLLATAPAGIISAAKPDFSQVPGTVVAHSPASSEIYLGSPGLCLLPDGTYLAKCDLFGPAAPKENGPITRVFRSTDRGETWSVVSELEKLCWASLFVHRGAAYLLGSGGPQGRKPVIHRSTDRGETWTVPQDDKTGVLRAEGMHHAAPTPVVEHEGRLWRAMELVIRGEPRHPLRPLMMSVPVDADLLDASAWTFSNAVSSERSWHGGEFKGWLEGNAVPTPEGNMVNILRAHFPDSGGKAAVVAVSEDGKTSSFDPDSGFLDFPGGNKKFTIRFDPVSGHYWTISNWIPPWDRGGNPERTRNTMALSSSADQRHWTVKAILVYHPDLAQHGFQYVDWQFDGNDLVALSRTACDDGLGGAHSQHDANFITFHRFAHFRDKTMEDSVPVERIEETLVETDDFTARGYGFEKAPFGEGTRAFRNRDYVWKNVPEELDDYTDFTRTDGGERGRIFLRAKRDCTVHVATNRGVSGHEMLHWTRVKAMTFHYTDKGGTGMQVFSRRFTAGEQGCVPQCSWPGTVVLLK